MTTFDCIARQGWCRTLVLALFVAFTGCGRAGTGEPQTKLPILDLGTYPGVGFIEAGDSDCTGTLISERVVLTAGHCVENRKLSEIAFTLDPMPDARRAVGFAPAKRVEIHPQYDPKNETPGVDIAVIELASTTYGPQPGRFPSLGDERRLRRNDVLTNVGYGENFDGSSGVKRAKEVRFTELVDLPIADGVILNGIAQVARGPKGEIGCAGDSGSPLMAKQGAYTVIAGVYSTSESDADKKIPERLECRTGITHGNYVVASSFRGWLQRFLSRGGF